MGLLELFGRRKEPKPELFYGKTAEQFAGFIMKEQSDGDRASLLCDIYGSPAFLKEVSIFLQEHFSPTKLREKLQPTLMHLPRSMHLPIGNIFD